MYLKLYMNEKIN